MGTLFARRTITDQRLLKRSCKALLGIPPCLLADGICAKRKQICPENTPSALLGATLEKPGLALCLLGSVPSLNCCSVRSWQLYNHQALVNAAADYTAALSYDITSLLPHNFR